MNDQGISHEDAIAHIQELDKRREHWTRCVWGVEASDNSNYDLIINLDQLSAPLAVSLISRVIGEETFKEDEEDRQQF